MKQDIVVPSLGESITQGILVQWLKEEGAVVTSGEELFELETDKATLAVPSPHGGILSILVPEGAEVSVGQVVGSIETDVSSAHIPSEGTSKEQTTEKPSESSLAADESFTSEALSPAVRKLISDNRLDPDEIVGTGKDSRITKGDVLAHLAERQTAPSPPTGEPSSPLEPPEAPKPPLPSSKPAVSPASASPSQADQIPAGDRQRRVPMPTIRRRIGERLVQAQRESAYLTTFNEVSMAKIMALRDQYNESFQKKHGVKLGFMSFFVRASCAALKEFPSVNAMIDGQDIVYNDFYDIGIAVSTERGLVVPVLRDADRLSFADIEKTIADFAERARSKRLTLDELTGGTFSISNGGVFGSLMSTPIPNPPQTAILGLHSIQKRPIVENDAVVIRPMMYLAVSYDHRQIDGREAVTFLRRIKDICESPERLMFEL